MGNELKKFFDHHRLELAVLALIDLLKGKKNIFETDLTI